MGGISEKSTSKDTPAESKSSKSIIAGGAVLLALIGIGAGSLFFLNPNRGEGTEEKNANPVYAEIALKNLAVGMRTYSVMTGGGGNTKFTGDVSKIREYVMQDAFQALQGEGQAPYHGFVIELTEYPVGDEFKTDFKFVARPSEGFIGQAYEIDKFEEVKPFNEPLKKE